MQPNPTGPAIPYRLIVLILATVGAVSGAIAWLIGRPDVAAGSWAAGTLPVLVALAIDIVVTLRRGDVGLDLIAALSMGTALAFGEPLAANVVALMYAGGEQLESLAEGRATREMTALIGHVARTALKIAGERMVETPIEVLQPGDQIYVRHGEVVPADGLLADQTAVLDTSPLTGESLPVTLNSGMAVLSGATNIGNAFTMTATKAAADSAYASIVRLVEQARASKAPSSRIADRYAIWFLLLTLVVAGLAWGLSGDRMRALAVLVVATPCPLILALPIAIISGMSRAASIGVLIKTAGALEALSNLKTAILDKTGTLTIGMVRLREIRPEPGFSQDDLLQLAASLDQASHHIVAKALIAAADEAGLDLVTPTDVEEVAGSGLTGHVAGRSVVLGGRDFVRDHIDDMPEDVAATLPAGTAIVAVAVDNRFAGVIALADELRDDAVETLASFRRGGIRRIVLASGDHEAVVADVRQSLDVDVAHGAMQPEDKLRLVEREQQNGPVIMVGDGVNDAPALARANVGVALGVHGTAASSETADVVLLVDRLSRLGDAMTIARRARMIAMQSVLVGLGLSIAAMVVAAFGFLPPVAGALTQEAIDIAVILNAMRVLR
ncbi:heavy metal translocating P-type ATPase [Hartmannibacter diazotrophicus]|uniref:heavy metal translocating P-type ATPase n=1 Tax=Hartmannibacter diazotrophicus TaxID=1482074 RepID=UPI001FE47147|nr:heavy metal translocating P-type ATPase [Hartmannibacter diazotrophicus]